MALNSPLVVLDRLLLLIHDRSPSLTGYAEIARTDYPLLVLRSAGEFGEFFSKLNELGWAEGGPDKNHDFVYRLSLRGWERVSELRRAGLSSSQAFVAMWFDSSMEPAWRNGIKPALVRAGWDPVRIDRVEHNEKIDDRIVAEIKRSGLLVADFTGQRGGVYFEAGLALGLGIPVIWTVNQSEIEKVHFDTRQYNHIAWSSPEELHQRLVDRILATVRPSSRVVADSRIGAGAVHGLTT